MIFPPGTSSRIAKTSYTPSQPTFDSVVRASGIEVVRTAERTPSATAIGKRFLVSVRRECLDHIQTLSDRHLYRVLKAYVAFFNAGRPPQGIEQQIPGKRNAQGRLSRHQKEYSTTYPFEG